METDYIKQSIFEIWNSNNGRAASSRLKAKFPDVYHTLAPMFEITDNIAIKAWMFVHDQNKIPTCYCGNCNKWLSFRRGFTQYCSTKCLSNSVDVLARKAATIRTRYNVDHFSKTLQYREKFTKTMLEKYGVKNPGQIEEKKHHRSKAKSNTFLTTLIDSISDKYQPMFTPDEFNGVRQPSVWQCCLCNETFSQSHMVGQRPRCDACYPKPKLVGESKSEILLRNWVQSILPNTSIIIKDRTVLAGKELDIYLPSASLAIEICGSWWHSDRFLKKNYHREKFINCEKNGIKLITLFDFDLAKMNIIQSMLKSNLNLLTTRLHARKGVIIEIDPATSRRFVEENHIRGHAAASYHYGWFHDNVLTAVATFRSARFKNDSTSMELIRACSKQPVNGFIGKVSSHVLANTDTTAIISYVDLRYGSGTSYLNSGFKLVRETGPGYWYVSNGICYHRSSFTKQNLIKKFGEDAVSGQTEFEIMDKNGYFRVWDCGNRLFIKERTK